MEKDSFLGKLDFLEIETIETKKYTFESPKAENLNWYH